MRTLRLFLYAITLQTLLVAAPSWTLPQDLPSGLGNKATPKSLGFDPKLLKKLDDAMAKVVRDGKVPGLSTLLVRHGKVANFATHGKMKADSIIRIYSMTKPITGVAMMILFEEGKWGLDDPITKYIPEFKDLRVVKGVDDKGAMLTEPVTRPPTMRELMGHTAGFGYGLFTDNPVDRRFQEDRILGASSPEELVKKVAQVPLKFQPGTDWAYSVAVDIQGYIVEKLSGQKLGDFMKQRIFDPLKMKDTAFQTGPGKAARLVPIYATDPKTGEMVEAKFGLQGAPLPNYVDPPKLQSAGGGLVSTIRDYGRFCQMILNKGILDDARILKPETVALMAINVIPQNVLAANKERPLVRFNEAFGFGLDFTVVLDPAKGGFPEGKGTISWAGAAGTWFWIDPANDLYFIGMIQRFGGVPKLDLSTVSKKLAYEALVHPEK